MSIKMLKAIAVLLMLLALGWVFGAISANSKSTKIQGPSALAVLSDQSVWVSVDKALWHLNENGSRIALVDGNALGIDGRIGNLVLHPNGQLVAQVRGDSTLYFLDAETAAIQSRLIPQWQSDLVQHGSDAINYAFHNDGRVAIATGGGHAVALFDAQGKFLARTKSDLYRFTNGLWWVGDTLWTTDTNRQELVELEGNTLAEKSRVQLSRFCGGYQFLGYGAPSHGAPSEWAKSAPLVTLVRFSNGMTKGRASDIFPDGSQLDFPVSGTVEPRDIRWRGKELLLVDGASFSIKRYADDRTSIDDFGDMQVQAELTGLLSQRNRRHNQYKLYIGGAILFFLVGFGFAVRAQLLEKRQALAALQIDRPPLETLIPEFNNPSSSNPTLNEWEPGTAKGFFNKLAANSFKQDEDALIYFPNGIFGKGRVIPDSMTKQKIFSYHKRLYQFTFLIVMPYSFLMVLLHQINFFWICPVIIVSAISFARQRYLIKGLVVHHTKLAFGKAIQNSSKVFPNWYYWVTGVFSIYLLGYSVWMPLKSLKPFSEILFVTLGLFSVGLLGLGLALKMYQLKNTK